MREKKNRHIGRVWLKLQLLPMTHEPARKYLHTGAPAELSSSRKLAMLLLRLVLLALGVLLVLALLLLC